MDYQSIIMHFLMITIYCFMVRVWVSDSIKHVSEQRFGCLCTVWGCDSGKHSEGGSESHAPPPLPIFINECKVGAQQIPAIASSMQK